MPHILVFKSLVILFLVEYAVGVLLTNGNYLAPVGVVLDVYAMRVEVLLQLAHGFLILRLHFKTFEPRQVLTFKDFLIISHVNTVLLQLVVVGGVGMDIALLVFTIPTRVVDESVCLPHSLVLLLSLEAVSLLLFVLSFVITGGRCITTTSTALSASTGVVAATQSKFFLILFK